MNKSKWLKKIIDMIVRISDLYGFNLLINEDFSNQKKECKLINDNNIMFLVAKSNSNEYSFKEFKDYLEAINKGFGFKNFKLEVKQNSFNLDYLVNGNLIGKIEDNKSLILKINLDSVINQIVFENRNLDNKPFYHLYLITLNDTSYDEALRAINVCRLGGLKSEIIFNPDDLEASISLAYENNSMFICTYDGLELTILNTKTNEEKQININELYPYVYAYIKGLNKCSGCKEKEE